MELSGSSNTKLPCGLSLATNTMSAVVAPVTSDNRAPPVTELSCRVYTDFSSGMVSSRAC